MDYIVLDLEWNQAADLSARQESGLSFEIIEIGAVKLDCDKNLIGSFHELIKPQVFHKMNEVTKEIIHINMKQLKGGRNFANVMESFLKWCGGDYIFCTWGNTDLIELQRNMDYYNMTHLSEKPIIYYDIQKLFSIAFEDKKTRRSLEYAIDFLNIGKDTAFHRADADAHYAAEILKRIEDEAVFRNYSYDTYRLPKSRDDEIHTRFDDYSKYISRAFPDKKDALSDISVVSTDCFICGSRTRRKIPWFTSNGKHYYSIVKCPVHGLIKCKIRFRKSALDESLYVVKTMKQASPEMAADIVQKRINAKNARKEKN